MPKFPTMTSCFILSDPVPASAAGLFRSNAPCRAPSFRFDLRPPTVVTCRMARELSKDREAIRDAITRICSRFGDDYWLERDRTGVFPHELHGALAADGWLGIALPRAAG